MPKIIITESTIPIALHELVQWSGKLTWERFAERLAERLGEKKISRHTLLTYPVIVEAFNSKKSALRDAVINPVIKDADLSIEFAKKQILILEETVENLQNQNNNLREQFVRWQHNLYSMKDIDMEKIGVKLDTPLPGISRR